MLGGIADQRQDSEAHIYRLNDLQEAFYERALAGDLQSSGLVKKSHRTLLSNAQVTYATNCKAADCRKRTPNAAAQIEDGGHSQPTIIS